jgi:hypothetical protein
MKSKRGSKVTIPIPPVAEQALKMNKRDRTVRRIKNFFIIIPPLKNIETFVL